MKELVLLQSPRSSSSTSTTASSIIRRNLAQIPFTGFSSDYVLRETQRSRAGLRGTNTLLWSGIDVDIPTEPTHSKRSPDGVRDAVLAAFHGNANGVILSRKYYEMKLTDLKGARAALQQLHLAA